MKKPHKLLIGAVLFFFGQNIMAQNIEVLTQAEWKLESFTVGQQPGTLPPTNQVEFVSIVINDHPLGTGYYLDTGIVGCGTFNSGDDPISIDQDSFNFMTFAALIGECSPEVDAFSGEYIHDLWLKLDPEVPYTLDDLGGGIWQLTVSINGDVAVYRSSVLSVNDLMSEKLKLYPNPTVGILNYSLSTKVEKINVYNLLGTLVKQYKGTNESKGNINTSTLSRGVYIFEFLDISGARSTQKVIKE